MTDRPGDQIPLDPFAAWRGMRDTYMDTWSKAMIDAVNSEAYAQAMGTALDSYLTASAPFRDALKNTMTQILDGLNMPSRADVTGVAERLTNIEMRLDDLDAKIDALQSSMRPAGTETAVNAARTKGEK